jgi:hypothetical protein
MNHHFERVADFESFGFDRERELAEGKNAFGFASDVHQQFVLIFLNDDAGEDLALVEDLERFFVETLLECELIFFFELRGVNFSRRDGDVPTLIF